MRSYQLATFITILLVLTACLAFAGTPRTFRVGGFNYYPGIFKDKDGVVKGFYVEALAEIARRENIRFEYVSGSWSEGLERIKSGELDLLTSVAVTPERTIFLDFGKTPLLTVWGELYTLPGSVIEGIRDVQGKKIAIMKADVNGAHFVELTKKFAISCDFVELPGFEDVFKAVADRRVDAGVVNSTFGAAKQREYALRSTGVVFNPFDIYFAVAKGKNRELLALLDRYLESWLHQEDSVYSQARQKWSHGTVGMLKVTPRWLTVTLILLAIISAVAALFVAILRIQVRRRTAELVAKELETVNYLEELKLKNFTIETISDAVYWIAADGRIWDVNPAACKALGYTKEELLSLSVLDINPDHSPSLWQNYWKELKEAGSLRFELFHRDKEGHVFPVEIRANFCKYGDIEFNCAVVQDISARKAAEAERLSLLAQLGQSQKLESIGRLAGGIAHDFNNLLTPIFCYTQILKKGAAADVSSLKMIDGIMQSAEKARILIQQILSFGRRQVLEMQCIDLNAVVMSFYDILRRTLPENIGIRLQLTNGEYGIRADKSQLEQIIMNLVVNAADAITENGIIIIETVSAVLDEADVRLHEGAKPGHYLVLAVSDSGSGMGEEMLAQIFEPFFTTKAVGAGTGLGLATVYGLVKQHGGLISVQSEIGQGTVFKLYFPIIDVKPVVEIETISEETAFHTGRLTILLVEDDEMVRILVHQLLTGLGFQVIAAEGPQQAISAMEGLQVDLLLTDVVMPDMSGPKLHQQLLKSRPGLKVLYMSGYTDSVIVHHGVIYDGVNLIMKPFAVNDLGRKIEAVLNQQ